MNVSEVGSTDTGWFSHIKRSERTPDFFAIQRRGGWLPVHDYYREDVVGNSPLSNTYSGLKTERDGHGYFRLMDCALGSECWPFEKHYRIHHTKQLGYLGALTNNRVLDKVRDMPVDLGVMFGERAQTAFFLYNTITKVGRAWRQLKHYDVSGAFTTLTGRRGNSWRDIPAIAGDAWLAFTYGLRPLIRDVYGTLKALEDRYTTGLKPRVLARSSKTADIGVNLFHTTNTDGFIDRWHGAYDGSVSANCGVWFEVDNPVLRALDQLGLLNPASVAWELVKFSFVADWFVNAGQFIRHMVPPQGITFIDGWQGWSVRGKSVNQTDHWGPVTGNPIDDLGWHTIAQAVETYVSRSRLYGFPLPRLVVGDWSLSDDQMLSTAALMSQLSGLGDIPRDERSAKRFSKRAPFRWDSPNDSGPKFGLNRGTYKL